MGCTASSSAKVVASQEKPRQQQHEEGGGGLPNSSPGDWVAEPKHRTTEAQPRPAPPPYSIHAKAATTTLQQATATNANANATLTQHAKADKDDMGGTSDGRTGTNGNQGDANNKEGEDEGGHNTEEDEELGVLEKQQQAAGVIDGVLSKTPSLRPVPAPLNLHRPVHVTSSMSLPEPAPKSPSPSSPGFFMHSRSVDDYHKPSFFAEDENLGSACDTSSTSSSSNNNNNNDDNNNNNNNDNDTTTNTDEDASDVKEASGPAKQDKSSSEDVDQGDSDDEGDNHDDDNSIGSMPPRESAFTLCVEDMDTATGQLPPSGSVISPQDAASKTATLTCAPKADSGRLTPTVAAPRRTSLSNILHAQRYEQARVMADLMHEGSERTDARIMEEWNTMRRSIGDRIQMTENKRRQSSHVALLLNRKGAGPKGSDHDAKSDTLHSITSSVGNMDSERAGCSELFNALNAGIIRPYIHDAEYMLLIDARDKAAFEAAHIVTAQHRDMVNPFIPYSEYSLLIVYDHDGSKAGPAAQLCDEIRASGAPHVTLLSGGYAKFSQRYPFISQATDTNVFMSMAEREALQHYPSEIRVQRIFLGNFLHAHSEKVVQDLGITHILNATMEHENKFPNAITYCSVRISDVPEEDASRHFERAADFIRSAVRSGGRVLVHCTMGVSRSTTLLVAYFIKYKRWPIKDALEFISDRRQGVKPNRSFLKQLSSWEESILGSQITDVDMLYF